jgi:hypothetical protein
MGTTQIFSRASLALGWLVLAMSAASFMRHPDGCGGGEGLWASSWFFAPLVLGIVGATTSRRRDFLALIAGASLLIAWLFAFGLWMLLAIVAGACQGG